MHLLSVMHPGVCPKSIRLFTYFSKCVVGSRIRRLFAWWHTRAISRSVKRHAQLYPSEEMRQSVLSPGVVRTGRSSLSHLASWFSFFCLPWRSPGVALLMVPRRPASDGRGYMGGDLRVGYPTVECRGVHHGRRDAQPCAAHDLHFWGRQWLYASCGTRDSVDH